MFRNSRHQSLQHVPQIQQKLLKIEYN